GQRLRCACRVPQIRIAGAQSEAGGGSIVEASHGLRAGENRGVRALNAGLCATASPSVGPREANFFPYLSIQLPPVGDHLLGVGDHSLSSGLECAGVDALSPWGGLRARWFQRDVSAQSDRQGGVSLGGTAGHRGATSARRRGIAPAVAAGARAGRGPPRGPAGLSP